MHAVSGLIQTLHFLPDQKCVRQMLSISCKLLVLSIRYKPLELKFHIR